ncbi:hypothetical protein FOL47_004835 [Perkinsus chesapeaki]|uniref:Uncharacterized protein n=1 Tax=Perkinsus chesapeaki TaxID=330153 RepID=A0A7J6M0T1_PERCH|nr:hypothetical protein FOL47_004835 [Perkinsus chesapeaki]
MAPKFGKYTREDVMNIFHLPSRPRDGGEVTVNLERISNTLSSHVMVRDLLLRERRSTIRIEDVDRLLNDLELIGCLPRPVQVDSTKDSSIQMGSIEKSHCLIDLFEYTACKIVSSAIGHRMRREPQSPQGSCSPNEEPISLSESESESVVTAVIVSSPEIDNNQQTADGSAPISPPLCSRCRGEMTVQISCGVQTDQAEQKQHEGELSSPKRRRTNPPPEFEVCDTRAPLPPVYGLTSRQRETEMRRLLSARYPVEDLTCFVVERPSGDDEPRYWLTPQKGSPDDRQLSLGETVPATPSRLANRALVECEVLLARASPRFLGRLERVMDRAYVRTAIPGVIEGHEYLVLASLSAIFPRKLDYPGELINCLLLAISPAREGSSCRGSLEITELVYHENESLLYGSSQSNYDFRVSAVDRGFESILQQETKDHLNLMQQTVSQEFTSLFAFVDALW